MRFGVLDVPEKRDLMKMRAIATVRALPLLCCCLLQHSLLPVLRVHNQFKGRVRKLIQARHRVTGWARASPSVANALKVWSLRIKHLLSFEH